MKHTTQPIKFAIITNSPISIEFDTGFLQNSRHKKTQTLIQCLGYIWRPQGGSNPRYRRERAVS